MVAEKHPSIQPGTQKRECLFGDVMDGEMVLNDAGRMVQIVWQEIRENYPGVETDEFIATPSHIHGIIVLVGAGPVPALMVGNHGGLPLRVWTEKGLPGKGGGHRNSRNSNSVGIRLTQKAGLAMNSVRGEAVRHISKDLRVSYPEVPWQEDIAGMRDKLIHDYSGVDIETVWLTATEDIPRLKARHLAS